MWVSLYFAGKILGRACLMFIMSKRQAIIDLHCAGKTNSEIIDLLKVAKSTVYNVVNRFKELGNLRDRPRGGRPRSVRTKKVIKVVCEKVGRDRKISVRTLAKKTPNELKLGANDFKK